MKKAIFVVLLLPFILAACSLASDLTPPPGYHPTAIVQPTAAPAVYPLVPPDPSQGAAIFTDKCVPCHGDTGMGNGDKAASLPNPVAAIGTTGVARLAKPTTWFDVITNGRIEKFMPPFASLTDRQRWDVIAYVYSLSEPASVIQTGKEAYTANCQSCHGAAGRGDGPQAASASAKVLDWIDPSFMTQRSDQDLYNATTNGVTGMPGYSTKLTDDQRWAVAAYIRSFSFASNAGPSASANTSTSTASPASTSQANTPAPTSAAGATSTSAPTGAAQSTNPAATTVPPNSTPASPATAVPIGTDSASVGGGASTPNVSGTQVVVTGKVNVNGKVTYTAGGTMPSNLKATLISYDNMVQAGTASANVNSDGTFSFPNVDIVSGRVWMAQVMYNNIPFSSQPLHDTDIKPGVDAALAVTISESSTDATVLSAQRLHVFFDFSVPGTLQVAELFIVQNNTNKAVVAADSTHPALQFQLPAGATNLSFQDGSIGDGRYVQIANGFGDNQAVPPQGTAQVLFAYEMPYANNTANVSVPIPMTVDSAVVLVPAAGVTVTGPQVSASGAQNVQGSGTINTFSASNLAKGSTLDLTVAGNPASAAPAGTTSDSSSPVPLIIGIGVFGVVLAGGGFWLFRQRRAQAWAAEGRTTYVPAEPAESAESILDAIVALDDLYQAGELPEEAYKERRAELKNRLKELRG
jgi:mono/diheme cytochrome c family protein